MTKLLDRPLKVFAIYALIILVISIPVYAWVVDYIWVNELDENNWLTLQHTKEKLQNQHFESEELEIVNRLWGEVQPGITISPADKKQDFQDSIYQIIRPNIYDTDNGEDRFRGLKSYAEIDGQPYFITIETNVEESDETFMAITLVTAGFLIILVLGFMVLNRRISKSSWQPFYETLLQLRSFDLSRSKGLELEKSNILEFEELNESLQKLVERNLAVYQQQKAFTENASHELQTPIALLKSKLDLLLQEKEISPEISEIINGIEAPLSRLSRINKNLLLLAKVENQQFEELEEIDIKSAMTFCISLFEDYAENQQIRIHNDIREKHFVQANPFLLETLLNNLVSNAIRHNSEKGSLILKLSNGMLSIYNSGDSALQEDSLFKRFSTSTSNKISSGLGLAIVKEIARQYGWEVSYRFKNKLHVFTVTF